ncbi:MAG: iron-containing alcohol dehydrogenase [Desulfurococcales archaeon]|nr:iron-containing alcohol dehydrogenase [Desulfurococcales archaeon]
MKANTVLIIADDVLSRETSFITRIAGEVEKASGAKVDIWSGTEPEPTDRSLIEGLKFAGKRRYDVIIAIGGGSTIDTAKLINLYSVYPVENIEEYFGPPIGAGKPVPGPLKPLIAIPTTAGTGSEASPVAVLTFHDKNMKVRLASDYLRPVLAILDPKLTVTVPPRVTVSTGLDALMHAIESFTSKPYYERLKSQAYCETTVFQGSNQVTEVLAEKAISLIGENLERAYRNGIDLEARSNMMLASHLAGIAFSNTGTHISHAISYALSVLSAEKGFRLPHGIAAAMTGPSLLKVLSNYVPQKCEKIAYHLRNYLAQENITPASAAYALYNLLRRLGLPRDLSELGFRESDVERIVQHTMNEKGLLAQSPMTPTEDLLSEIVRMSINYELLFS